jgi:hypothetical protein
LFVVYAIVATFPGPRAVILVDAVVMLLTGALCGAVLLLSWRLYHPMFSWALWAVPGAALFEMAAAFTVLPQVDTGEISILRAVSLILGCGGLGFFGPPLLLRGAVKRWLGMQ